MRVPIFSVLLNVLRSRSSCCKPPTFSFALFARFGCYRSIENYIALKKFLLLFFNFYGVILSQTKTPVKYSAFFQIRIKVKFIFCVFIVSVISLSKGVLVEHGTTGPKGNSWIFHALKSPTQTSNAVHGNVHSLSYLKDCIFQSLDAKLIEKRGMRHKSKLY